MTINVVRCSEAFAAVLLERYHYLAFACRHAGLQFGYRFGALPPWRRRRDAARGVKYAASNTAPVTRSASNKYPAMARRL